MRLHLALLTATALLAGTAPAARADDLVAELARDTPVGAYGGARAWSAYDTTSGRYRLVVIAAPGAAPAHAPIPSARQAFDVSLGPDTNGDPVALYTRCSRSNGTRGCDIHRYDIRLRSERRLAFSRLIADEAWPVQWGARVAFVRRHRSGGRGEIDDCDVPYVKTVSSTAPPRRLDRGSCGTTTGMSIRRDRIIQVTFGSPPRATRFESQVRRLSAGGGAVKVLARQGSGEESNAFSSPSQSASTVWVTRTGVNPRPMFVRVDPLTGARREVRANTNLTGPLARDPRDGHFLYVEGGEFAGESCQELIAVSPCRLVDSAVNPFSSRQRALLPTLTITSPGANTAPPPAFGDPFALSGRLARTIVSAGAIVRRDPIAHVPIELLRRSDDPARPQFGELLTPTGILVTTGPDGRWAHTLPVPPPRPAFSAVTRSPLVPATYAGRGTVGQVDARITLAVSGSAFAGTVAPGQPGLTVRIQRLTSRRCQTAVTGQRFCRDTWATVSSAALTGAGTTFSANVPAPQAGTYRAAILAQDVASNPSAYSGASPDTAVGR